MESPHLKKKRELNYRRGSTSLSAFFGPMPTEKGESVQRKEAAKKKVRHCIAKASKRRNRQ